MKIKTKFMLSNDEVQQRWKGHLLQCGMAEAESFSVQAVIFVTILLVYVLTSHLIEIKEVPYLHESTVAIIMGFLTAVFAKYQTFDEDLEFSGELFFTIILPPIIFSAGYSLRKSLFQSFLKFPIKETSLILLNGYLTYLIGEVTGLSGIISLFTCAIIMGHYSFMNLSQQAQRGTGLAFETVSYVAEAFVFAYLGASVLSINSQWMAVGMAFLILCFLPGVRAMMVYALPCIYSMMKIDFPLNGKEVKVCWYSGMVRGVIAFALCLQIQGNNEDFIRTIAMIVVMITTILGSSLLKTFAKCIGLDDDVGSQSVSINYQRMLDDRINLSENFSNYHNIGLGYESDHPQGSISDSQKSSSATKKMQEFQNKFVRPYFEKKNQQTHL